MDEAILAWYLARFGIRLPRHFVIPLHIAIQGHPEAGAIWERHIVAILEALGFKSTTMRRISIRLLLMERNIFSFGRLMTFVWDVAVRQRQRLFFIRLVSGFSVLRKLRFHSSFWVLLLLMFNGMDIVQARGYIKIGCWTYIRRFSRCMVGLKLVTRRKVTTAVPTDQ